MSAALPLHPSARRSPPTPAERRIRAALPLARWLAAYLPIPLLRGLMRLGERFAAPPSGVRREEALIAGVRCEWLVPERADTGAVLLYLHGGGFTYGWSWLHRPLVAEFAKRCGLPALAVDYRLAPEHPFPAAVDDCLDVYRGLLELGISPRRIVIAGDSAGGNLTLTTLIAARDAGLRLPAGGICLSAVTAFVAEDVLLRRGVEDALLHPRALRRFRDAYLAGGDMGHPLLSPAHASLHGLPPLLLQAGSDELFRVDAEHLADAAARAGVDTRLEIYPGMWHVWQINVGRLAQADEAVDGMARFVAECLGT